MASNSLYLGVVLVIAVIIIAYFAWRSWRKNSGKSKFSYTTPATPLARKYAGQMISTLVQVTENLEEEFRETTAPKHALAPLMSIVKSIRNASLQLSHTPPTYANYLAIYRGLESADSALLTASEEFIRNGRAYELNAMQNPAKPDSSELKKAGERMVLIGKQLRLVVQAIHQFGVALDLE